MQRTPEPFRADEVGSLCAAEIKEARAKLEKGEISAADLRKVEDMEMKGRAQAGLDRPRCDRRRVRRSWWHFDFLAKLRLRTVSPRRVQFAGVQTRHDAVR
jgi:5-methyltetrahydropteroyltriglutamate--homocysteine methyltransferase